MDRQTSRPPVTLIPRPWRETVRDILHRRCAKDIIPTKRARDDWMAACPDAFLSDLYTALETTLDDDGLLGRLVPDLTPRGEAHEFMFFFGGRQFYAKLNLVLPERKVVWVVSAHPPYKGDQL
jgi:hypothetical protein